MTIIVYDNEALITDSYGLVRFSDVDRLGYYTNKIHYNESRTLALAYSGETRSDSDNKWLFRCLEIQAVLCDMEDLYAVTGEPIVRKLIESLLNVQEHIKIKPHKNNSGIAITRDFAIQFDSSGYRDITGRKYLGEGAEVEAYWTLRAAGRTPAQAMQKLDEVSQLCGGPINMQLQSGLAKPDVQKYCTSFIEKDEINMEFIKNIRLEALPPPKVTKKRKGV